MTTTAFPGPLSVEGAPPSIVGTTPYIGSPPAIVNSNPDFAPSLLWMGMGVRDPRYLQRIGAGPNVAGGYPNQDCGWMDVGRGLLIADFVPPALAANNISAAAAVVAGTPVTLAAASTGITISPAGGTLVLPTGNVIPAGALIIDGAPAWTGSGTSGAFAFFNPAHGCSRGIGVTATGGGVVSFKVSGTDLYGYPQTETLVANGAVLVPTKKTYKAITSIVPATTDAGHTYEFGTADLFGFATRVNLWPMVSIFYGAPPANVLITSNTGWTAADNTAPSLTSGDVRGSYQLQVAADGTNRLTIMAALPFAVVANTVALATAALLGNTPS